MRVATGLDHPRCVSVDAKFAYFVTGEFAVGDNSVKGVPLSGGAPFMLAQSVKCTLDMALSDSAVYFFEETEGTFARGSTA